MALERSFVIEMTLAFFAVQFVIIYARFVVAHEEFDTSELPCAGWADGVLGLRYRDLSWSFVQIFMFWV